MCPKEGWLLNAQIFWSRGNDRFFDGLRKAEEFSPIPNEEIAEMRRVMGVSARTQTLILAGRDIR